jgi:hypothetical protein
VLFGLRRRVLECTSKSIASIHQFVRQLGFKCKLISGFVPERPAVQLKNHWDSIPWKKDSGLMGDLYVIMDKRSLNHSNKIESKKVVEGITVGRSLKSFEILNENSGSFQKSSGQR